MGKYLVSLPSSGNSFVLREKKPFEQSRQSWTELEVEFPKIFNLCTTQSLWFVAQKHTCGRKNTEKRGLEGGDYRRENVVQETRLGGITIKIPTKKNQFSSNKIFDECTNIR